MVVGRIKAQKCSCRDPLIPSPRKAQPRKAGEELWRVQCSAVERLIF
jgi:hypothetical protein